ncbi:DUF4166 domain-containing protein [Sphaerisporangium aureirubrum]|uniref:DUF4166 domain-containing protein n=1 Tax=Sphaerisporangium aureirubrum TaxID=1544736 RepID=A0ABW1NC44_9ACTN
MSDTGSVSGSEEWMRRFHLGTGTVAGTGELTVRRGPGILAGVVCALLRLPRTAEGVPITVVVRRRPAHHGPRDDGRAVVEHWTRRIGSHRLVTTQLRTGSHGWERHGPFVLHTRTVATPGEVVVTQDRAVLGVGPLSVRLPVWSAPRVWARARAEPGEGARFHLEVRVTLPVLGSLLSYSGHLDETPA